MKNENNIAKLLGSRGGKKRAQKLSSDRKKEIATLGGKAKAESLKIARRIQANFEYVKSFKEFAPPPKVKSVSQCNHKLPGIYV